MAEVVAAVAQRHLKSSGHVVPARVLTRLHAVSFHSEGWGVWTDDFYGFDLSAVQNYAPSAAQLHFFTDEPMPLSPPAIVADEVMGAATEGVRDRIRLEIVQPGTLHAVIGYFTATLADGVTLSNHPGHPGCNWAVWVWPLRHTTVQPGQTIDVKIKRPADVRLAADWQLDCAITRVDAASRAR
jgi:enediyne biosynthesis protein CalE3